MFKIASYTDMQSPGIICETLQPFIPPKKNTKLIEWAFSVDDIHTQITENQKLEAVWDTQLFAKRT